MILYDDDDDDDRLAMYIYIYYLYKLVSLSHKLIEYP